jgi:hypothetical protein
MRIKMTRSVKEPVSIFDGADRTRRIHCGGRGGGGVTPATTAESETFEHYGSFDENCSVAVYILN